MRNIPWPSFWSGVLTVWGHPFTVIAMMFASGAVVTFMVMS